MANSTAVKIVRGENGQYAVGVENEAPETAAEGMPMTPMDAGAMPEAAEAEQLQPAASLDEALQLARQLLTQADQGSQPTEGQAEAQFAGGYRRGAGRPAGYQTRGTEGG